MIWSLSHPKSTCMLLTLFLMIIYQDIFKYYFLSYLSIIIILIHILIIIIIIIIQLVLSTRGRLNSFIERRKTTD